ncbi:hypothetical protein CRM22_001619 [Opisthorchis felineus]|uniref:EGF-like domain-containing protein n=1 Tax=Opisthorchis felineus TaxID=147828 RepID=A0A4S2M9T9_OPIFE|nr:hypothetical protein CRM22_001619 [Opisthorchis felineus]
MKVVILLCLLPLMEAISVKPEFWVDDLLKTWSMDKITVRHHRLGRNFLRGFPRGSWGTVLFPVLPVVPSEDIADDYFKPIFGGVFDLKTEPEDSYTEFRAVVKEKFCEGNDKKPWKCCSPDGTRSDCENVPDNAKNLMNTLIDPLQGMPIIFLYQWCTMGWAKYDEMTDASGKKDLRSKLEATCPNPCLGNPCRRIPLVNNTKICEVTGSFENDFKCDCESMAEWDPYLLTCRRKNPCLNDKYPPCVSNNTLRCVATDDAKVKCVCKSEYMGEDCSLERNACFERLNKSQTTGNENCRVHLGNECNGVLGTDSYNCTCQYGYEPLLELSEDNCFVRRDPCQTFYAISTLNKNAIDLSKDEEPLITESEDWAAVLNGSNPKSYIMHRGVTCMNGGQCITSADMSRAICLCPTAVDGSPLFSGPNCEIPIGTWSAWSSLSQCLPRDCGLTRYRWRRRRCLNSTSREDLLGLGRKSRSLNKELLANYTPTIRCTGTSEEVLPCDPKEPCMILRLPGYVRGEILNYGTLYYFGVITAIYLCGSFLSWYVFANPIIRAVEKRKQKAAAIVIHRASPIMPERL